MGYKYPLEYIFKNSKNTVVSQQELKINIFKNHKNGSNFLDISPMITKIFSLNKHKYPQNSIQSVGGMKLLSLRKNSKFKIFKKIFFSGKISRDYSWDIQHALVYLRPFKNMQKLDPPRSPHLHKTFKRSLFTKNHYF